MLIFCVSLCQWPEVGTVSQGYSMDEALENLKESTELYLEEFPMESRTRTFMTSFELQHA